MNCKSMLVLCVAAVGFQHQDANADTNTVVEMGADWKYFDKNELPDENWAAADFDDSGWAQGAAPLGYGDDDIKQTVSFGDNADQKNLCVFFRNAFELTESPAGMKLVCKLVCDDGCAIYVNGKEVHRYNLPDGELKLDTLSRYVVGGGLERHGLTLVLDGEQLTEGTNVIAVRVHQQGPASSDLAMDMEVAVTADEASIEQAEATHDQEQSQLELYEAQQ